MLQYLLAVVLVGSAVFLTHSRPVLEEVPYIFFLAAVTMSALFGGLGPAFLATALSALAIRLLFIEPRFRIYHYGNLPDLERVCWFVVAALMVGSLVAACRRERDLLQDSEDRYRILAEAASDAIVVIDERCEILFLNAVAEKTFGASAEKLVGQNLTTLLPENSYQAQLAAMKDHLDTRRTPVIMKLPGRTLHGAQILLEMSLGTISIQGRSLFTANLRDVTESRELCKQPTAEAVIPLVG